MIKKKVLDSVKMNEIGMMISVIKLDYQPKNNEELSSLIQEHFNVLCTETDIKNYKKLHIQEDYETESRKHSFFMRSR